MHNLPSSTEFLAGRRGATKPAPEGCCQPGQETTGEGSSGEQLPGLLGNTEAAKPTAKDEIRKKRGRLPPGKEKKRREPGKEAVCYWAEGLEGRTRGLLPKRFLPLTLHPGYTLQPGRQAGQCPWEARRPGRRPLYSPQPGAGAAAQAQGEGPRAAAPRDPARLPARRARRRRPAPASYFQSTHPTRSGASRPGGDLPPRGPRVTDRGRHLGAARRGGQRQPRAQTNALRRRPASGLILQGPAGSRADRLRRPRSSYLLLIRQLLLQIRHFPSGDKPRRRRQPPDFPLSVRSSAPRAPQPGRGQEPSPPRTRPGSPASFPRPAGPECGARAQSLEGLGRGRSRQPPPAASSSACWVWDSFPPVTIWTQSATSTS